MNSLKSISDKIDFLRNKLNNVDKNDIKVNEVNALLDKKILTREEFYSNDFMMGYVRADSMDDISVGDFVRYKIRYHDGNVKYLWGGLVTFISPVFIRLKNVYAKRSWSVQLQSKNETVFYVKKKMSKDDVEAYTDLIRDDRRLVDLNTATTEGLLAEIIKRGDLRLIVETAKLITESNQETMIL